MTQRMRNFSILNAQSITINVTSTSQAVALRAGADSDLMIYNKSGIPVYVRTGGSNVEADLNAMPIVGGEKGVYSKGLRGGNTTHIAAITESGTAELVVLQSVGS